MAFRAAGKSFYFFRDVYKRQGFHTSDDVWFLADSLTGEEVLEKYHVSFLYDVKAYLESLEKVEELSGKLFIPAHAEPREDIRPLVQKNREKVLEIAEVVRESCRTPKSTEEVIQTVFERYDLKMDAVQFVLAGSTIRSYLSYLREKYQGKIQLCIGVELGLQPHLGEKLPAYIAQYPFDFVIGSTHVSRRLDPYEKEFFEGISEKDAYRIYFEEELENLRQYDCYDVAGHIDYVIRYGPAKACLLYTSGHRWCWSSILSDRPPPPRRLAPEG